MAVTRSWAGSDTRPELVSIGKTRRPRRGKTLWLMAASLLIAAGLAMVYAAKSQSFPAAAQLIDVNRVVSPEELLPALEIVPDRAQRQTLAESLFAFLERARPIPNIGALSALRRRNAPQADLWAHVPLARLKPLLLVRSPNEFRLQLLRSALLYFAGFYLVALVWRLARFRGDRSLLPALHLLTGIGFLLMASMRDPLRDTLEFHKFALGVFLGCLLLALPAIPWFDYRRLSDWCYTPLFGALLLFGLLLRFGRGPGGATDTKVNLGPFQPVELIKILLVLFLAGYFTRNWERLRDLRERRLLPALRPPGNAAPGARAAGRRAPWPSRWCSSSC